MLFRSEMSERLFDLAMQAALEMAAYADSDDEIEEARAMLRALEKQARKQMREARKAKP